MVLSFASFLLLLGVLRVLLLAAPPTRSMVFANRDGLLTYPPAVRELLIRDQPMAGTRYRAPQASSTAVITRAGFERLRAELDELWRVRRPEVVLALSAAAAEGDRSENAEYTYRKRQLGEIDRRVRYLTKRLEQMRVVDTVPADPRAVFFGAWLLLEALDEERELKVRIVGPDETDAKLGWISIDSPLARAALKKRIDDEFEVELPAGRARYVIVEVSYTGPD